MAKVIVQVKRWPGSDAAVPLPVYQTSGAAGADLCANLPGGAATTLAPGERALIPTGLAFALPSGFEMQIRARSGLALQHGLALVNGIGTIDADHRGEVGVILINLGDAPVVITHGQRIAQAVLAPVTRAAFEISDDLDQTARGGGGFGSTGVAG